MFFLWHGEHWCAVAAQSITVNVMDKFCLLVVEVKVYRLQKQNACVDSWDSMKPFYKGAMAAQGGHL